MSELLAVFPVALDHVDAIVSENGGVLATPAGVRLLAVPVGHAVSSGLNARGIAHRTGQAVRRVRAPGACRRPTTSSVQMTTSDPSK
jgi:hypothetical protein